MTTELFSFKLLIHSYSLDRNFYHSIGSYINVPGFAVQLFDYPTFIIYSTDRLHEDQLGQDRWIKFGNGKSTAFEMSEEQLTSFINDRPLIINFIDAENKQVRVFSKAIVTLQAFKNDLQNYLEKNQENWKRKVFLMFDEARNQVGKIDLSLSIAKRRQNIINKPTEEGPHPVYHQPIPDKPQFGTSYIKTISEAPTRAQQQQSELALKTRSKTDDYIENQRSYHEAEVVDVPNPNLNENTFGAKSQQNKQEKFAVGPPTLKTMVEGFYCPPVMLFQKKKKLVRFASNEEQPIEPSRSAYYNNERPLSSPNKMYRSTEQQRFAPAQSAFKKSTSSVSMADNVPEQTVRPVVVLSNKESEKLVDLYSLKGNKDENVGLLDLLIKELVNLKTASGQTLPDSYAKSESLQIGSLRGKESSQGIKQGGPIRRSSFGREIPGEKNKENHDSNQYSPKKINKAGIRKNDIANEIIKETYEEANQPEDEYSQIFESISASQSFPKPVISTKKGDLANNRRKNSYTAERMESIGESYPEDFEQFSAASLSRDMSYRNKPNKQAAFDDSRVSEDIAESASRTYGYNKSNSLTKKDSFKRDPLRESIRSEYSEDFENLSEDNY